MWLHLTVGTVIKAKCNHESFLLISAMEYFGRKILTAVVYNTEIRLFRARYEIFMYLLFHLVTTANYLHL